MFTKTINNIEGVEATMQIKDTEHSDIKHLKYNAGDALEFTGFIPAHVALILQESQVIMQPDGLTNITHEVQRLFACGEIVGRVEEILDCN